MIESRHVLQPLLIVDGGISGVEHAGRHVVGHAALRGDRGAVANRKVARNSYLPGEDAAIADGGRSGQAGLTAEHAILADRTAVADQNQIVDLGAALDAGLPDGGAVHAGIGLHLDVIIQNNDSRLQRLAPTPVGQLGEAEPVGADHHAVLQEHTVADAAGLREPRRARGQKSRRRFSRRDRRSRSYAAPRFVRSLRFHPRSSRVRCALPPRCAPLTRRPPSGEFRAGMEAAGETTQWRGRSPVVDPPSAAPPGGGSAGSRSMLEVSGQQRRRGPCGANRMAVARVRYERKLPGLRIFDSGHTKNSDVSPSPSSEHPRRSAMSFSFISGSPWGRAD